MIEERTTLSLRHVGRALEVLICLAIAWALFGFALYGFIQFGQRHMGWFS